MNANSRSQRCYLAPVIIDCITCTFRLSSRRHWCPWVRLMDSSWKCTAIGEESPKNKLPWEILFRCLEKKKKNHSVGNQMLEEVANRGTPSLDIFKTGKQVNKSLTTCGLALSKGQGIWLDDLSLSLSNKTTLYGSRVNVIERNYIILLSLNFSIILREGQCLWLHGCQTQQYTLYFS